ncbi:MAG TPA: hypothetical protein PLP07_05540 [Pyrinomonadaceae bacterium]|nr:hypothetical protein [Chloracidobacterium sp.]MBP9935575.1 hypothetical protein [Pyrinomonadaceae bacterium]MBK7801140.1 hypothetical protein [Chloracidobacterium sp.]MBK9436463.1 hypothetical protein [Chloracidobacterium sp.]MBK9767331.1 hypothetical protein [Chloracidobacterium sp.]
MKRKLCFLTMDDIAHYVADDELAIEPLSDRGWEVSTLSWSDRAVNWDEFEIAIIRTTWDYQQRPGEFLQVLDAIDRSSAQLQNPLDIVKWNLDKRYLREMEERGVAIVPTIWDGIYDQRSLYRWMADLGSEELIIKPTVSATAMHTYRLTEYDPELTEVFVGRPFMVQPFVTSIVERGEYSVFYFGGEYSHAILKAPKADDFRVQEEHGGIITAVDPGADLISSAKKAISAIDCKLLYARVDLVQDANGKFILMEIELIEPALYLRMDAGAPARFAAAIDDWMP